MTGGRNWAKDKPSPESWQPQPGRLPQDATSEQDSAAGGREQRLVPLRDGSRATASVELKFLGGRRVYGYLRFSEGGRTRNRYIGEAPGKTRKERLRIAWRKAREKGLLG